MAHDVSRELRGPHGEWTKGGALLHRLSGEATAGGAQTRGMSHDEVLGHVRNVGKGTGRRINGHRIDRTQGDKYRVGLLGSGARDTKVYQTPEGAAKAIAEGQHHDEGKSRALREVVSGAPSAPPAGKFKSPTPEVQMTEVRKRQGEIAAASGQWAGKAVEIHSGPFAGETGKVIRADQHGVVMESADGTRYNPGLHQIREAPATLKVPLRGDEVPDTGYTPGKGITSKYRGAGPASKYARMSDAELLNYEISKGSEAARQERLRREAASVTTAGQRNQAYLRKLRGALWTLRPGIG
jgi:hypothetical protein